MQQLSENLQRFAGRYQRMHARAPAPGVSRYREFRVPNMGWITMRSIRTALRFLALLLENEKHEGG